MKAAKFFSYTLILTFLSYLTIPTPYGIVTIVKAQDELERLGLPKDVGRDEVEAYCDACHSLKLVVQQGLSREVWDETLDWMVDEHEMSELGNEDRQLVLNYLSKHISIEAARKRRKQINKLNAKVRN